MLRGEAFVGMIVVRPVRHGGQKARVLFERVHVIDVAGVDGTELRFHQNGPMV
ncbi:MAG TPA: hypothetical protein VKA04_11215 [Pseudodesulfovibrio sp.]|nr:hypothetical protein [Pseudodesulfovibrio sp.]